MRQLLQERKALSGEEKAQRFRSKIDHLTQLSVDDAEDKRAFQASKARASTREAMQTGPGHTDSLDVAADGGRDGRASSRLKGQRHSVAPGATAGLQVGKAQHARYQSHLRGSQMSSYTAKQSWSSQRAS